MLTYDPSSPLFSVHIPKCAGRSFRVVLESWFNRRLYRHYRSPKTGAPPDHHRLSRSFWLRAGFKPGICVHGHFNHNRGFGIDDYYAHITQRQCITVLRDPFQMQISNYFFRKELQQQHIERLERRRERLGPLAVAMEPPPKKKKTNINRHLRKVRSYLLHFFPPEISLDNFRSILDQQYIYIGIAEDLQTTVDRLAERLDKPRMEVSTIGASKHDEEIEPGVESEFRARHELEYAIYEYALETYAT